MPSSFSSFEDGDIIHASHILEVHEPIQNLERGAAFYAGSTGGSSTAYTATLDPAPDSPYSDGMIVNVKIDEENVSGSPDVTLSLNSQSAKPIIKNGGDSLEAGDLKAGQIVSLIFDEAADAFQLLSVAQSSGGGVGSGADELADLNDCSISSPSNGQVLRYDGSDWVNADLGAADIGAGTVSDTEFGYLDGVTSSVQTQLDNKITSNGLSTATNELVFTGSSGALRMDTSDGSDTGQIHLNGGGANGMTTRGGRIGAFGNEHATRPGVVHLRPGDVAGSHIKLDDGSSTEQLKINTSGVTFSQLGSGLLQLTLGLASVKSNADVYQMLFTGTRADGNVTISSNTTLTRDMNYDTLTVQTGVVLRTDGYVVRARKIVLQGSGRLENSGNNGGAVNVWDFGAALVSHTLGGGAAAATGTNIAGPTGNGAAEISGGGLTRAAGGTGGPAGSGGSGPSGSSGGTAGPTGVFTNTYFCGSLCPEAIERGDTIVLGGGGGASGGGGAPDGTNQWSGGTSGGGGSGGGVMVVLCDELDVSSASAGCIRARGGNAAFGASTWSSLAVGGAGGSGGGGGGYLHGFFGKVTGTLSDALDCNGGAGSAGTNGNGSGMGGVGGGGGSGGNIDVYRADTSSWISVRGSSGSSGSAPSGPTGGAAGAAGTCKANL